MIKRVSARERVLFAFGAILALLFGVAVAIRNHQIASFVDLASETLQHRRLTVESALKLSNAEAQNVLNRSRLTAAPESWLSPVDPDLVAAKVSAGGIARSRTKPSIPISDELLREIADLGTSNKSRGASFVERTPVEFWAVRRPDGVAIVLRIWDTRRRERFERLANCEVAFRAGSAKGTVSALDAAQVGRTLSTSFGETIGSLNFTVVANEISEGQENANESAGLLIASAVGALGLLFIVLHRKILEPMRVIGVALEKQSIEPNQLQIASDDEFGQILQQLQRVFVQKHILFSANEELERVVRLRTKDHEDAYDATITGFSLAMELRDKETEGHCRRVAGMAVRLASLAGLSSEETTLIYRGALLHDVGKLGIPDSILLKKGKLTAEEYELMKRHTTFGYEMLKPIPFLQNCLDICLYHHEKWDGSGYPAGLKGDEIPLAARIFAFADVYDALRSDRPYRTGAPDAEVKAYIAEQSGTHFDPHLAKIFANMECDDFWTDLEAATKRDEAFFRPPEDAFTLKSAA